MGAILLLACTAALNPTLLAATTVMLALDNPKKLLLGYLCGALLTSVTLGLVIVLSVDGSSSTTSSAQKTVNPIVDLALGAIILVCVFVVGTGRDKRRRARKAAKAEANKDKAPPKWKQKLSGGTARTTFVIGAVLTLPGASYLAGLHEMGDQNLSTTAAVLAVLGFNVIMLLLLELPLIGYTVKPEWTALTVHRFNDWLARSGGKMALRVAGVVGILLVVRGIITLIAS
jgi:hypothetical protein